MTQMLKYAEKYVSKEQGEHMPVYNKSLNYGRNMRKVLTSSELYLKKKT